MTDRDHPHAEQLSHAAVGDEKQRVGAVFWVTIAITAAFVAWGAFALTSFTAVLGAVVASSPRTSAGRTC